MFSGLLNFKENVNVNTMVSSIKTFPNDHASQNINIKLMTNFLQIFHNRCQCERQPQILEIQNMHN